LNTRSSGTPSDCPFVSLSAQQTLVELSLTLVVMAVESGERFVLSKHSVFSTTASGGRDLQRLMLISRGQDGPSDARQLVGDRDHDFVERRTLS
jgi:hypothetical protein